MDLDTLHMALREASVLAVGMGFLAGIVFAFNPMVFATIPVVLAYVTKAHEPRRAALLSGAFVAGMLTVHAILGIATAAGGEWTRNAMGREWGLVLGPILIFLGFLWPGWLKIRIPWLSMRGRKVSGVIGAFLLSIPFTLALCPACTPALLVTLTASAAIGSVPFGLALLLAFGIGRSVPVLIGALGLGWLQSLTHVARYHRSIEMLGGITFILTGLYLIYAYRFII